MKFYVFDIKTVLSLTDKEKERDIVLLPIIMCTCSTINMLHLGKKNREHSFHIFNKGVFYSEELILVFTSIVESDLNIYVNWLTNFKHKKSVLDPINRLDEYNDFYSNINGGLMSNLLLGSYKVIEDFDLKLEEAKSQGIINPIAHILAKKTEHKLND